MTSPSPRLTIDKNLCTRCGLCIKDCIVKALTIAPDGTPCMPEDRERYCIGCQHCLAVCPSGALSIYGRTAADCLPPGPLPRAEEMENLIRQRRSVRFYRPDPVEPEILERLKDSLHRSPTGCNDHRLFFRIIGPEEMKEYRIRTGKLLKFLIRTGIMRLVYPNYRRYLASILNGEDVIYRDAPYMIVAATPKNAPCALADPWIALTQFDLLAQTFGLGTCWCGFAYFIFRYIRNMRKRLKLPSGYKVGAVLLFGRPDIRYSRVPDPEEVQNS